jgi:hypothetical protein
MLEHVTDARAVVSEAARIVKDGGYIVISVPNTVDGTFAPFRRLQMEFNLAGHVREFEEDEVRLLAEACGLTLVQIERSSFFVYWIAFAVDRSGMARRIVGLYKRFPKLELLSQSLLARLIRIENRLFSKIWRGGMCCVALLQKR